VKPATRRPVVTGTTVFVPLVGHPVTQVKSPGPMNRWFHDNDVDAVIVPMDVRPERVASFFELLRAMENCAGCSVTMPHKQAAFVACDEVSDRARRAKAANTIRRSPSGRLVGDMTDGPAFVAALATHGVSPEGAHVLLVGAGAAGTAIAFELAAGGAKSLTLVEVDQMRRRALLSELGHLFPRLAIFEEAQHPVDIAVNASPLGMSPGDPMPFPVERLAGARIVADAVTSPEVTPWLEAARRQGLEIQTGEEMAVAQLPIQLGYLRFTARQRMRPAEASAE
jgi:shikimate dehydrogenase